MKNSLLLFVIALALFISTASAAQDSKSATMKERIREIQKKSMRRRPPRVNRERRDEELRKLQSLSKEDRRKRLQELRDKGILEMEALRAARAKDGGINPAKGTFGQQSLETLTKQLADEEAKHLKRLAKLSRIRELSTKAKAQKTLGRVKKLIIKEQFRYSNKLRRLQNRKRMFERLKIREKEIKGPGKEILTKEAIEKARKQRYPGPPRREYRPNTTK